MPEQKAAVKVHHTNDGQCKKCAEIFDLYPGVNKELREWFEKLQWENNDAHISCAGRGKAKQEQAVKEGKSRAHWTRSSHNWNCAIDIFQMIIKENGSIETSYNRKWFNKVVAPNVPNYLTWYGAPGASFPELPHVQVKDWVALAKSGKSKLVE